MKIKITENDLVVRIRMKLALIIASLSVSTLSFAQEPTDGLQVTDTVDTDEKPKFQQQPGLALAASKIFFSEKRYAVSGFGEFNYVPIQPVPTDNPGDLELYYSGLYRYATFFGYRITDKLIWNSEVQVEFLHYKAQESHHEFIIEAFVDYLFRDYLKARIGFYPLTIGYVNNNDEPVMFYSVNRSEVERLITPSTWIELGAMFYGTIGSDWSYALGFSQGLNSKDYLSGSWVRQGREIRLNMPKSISINPQISYTGVRNLTLSASGYFGNSGQGETVEIAGENVEVKGNIKLTSAYAKYHWGNFQLVSVGTYGQLGDTDKIYELTNTGTGDGGQVIGKEVYGYLIELGCDILPYLRKRKKITGKEGFLYNSQELKLSLFGRYERLNTHQGVHQSLIHLPRVENNMDIWTIGVNFNTRTHLVLKANYQYRNSKILSDVDPGGHIVETGVGFIF